MSEQNRTVEDEIDDDDLKAIKKNAGKKHNYQELHINRVPDDSVSKLKTLAREKFAGDYGMTIAYLLELHEVREDLDAKLVNTNRKVVELEDELTQLKQALRDNEEDTTDSKVNTLQ